MGIRSILLRFGVIATGAGLAACAAGPVDFPAAGVAGAGLVVQAPDGPCDSEVYHAFDFWAGNWDVYDPAGNLAGSNSIQREENGCVLVERWTGSDDNTGQSYNFYDPGLGKWRQVWISGGAVINYAGGLAESGSMLLTGTIAYRQGALSPFTGEWTLNEDGSVTQHFRQQDTATGDWSDWFVGRYVRKAD